jgi:putative membrane protein
LHALSPLLRSSRALAALATVLATRQLAQGQEQNPWIDLGLLGVAAAAATVSWLVTRWRIHNGELQIETGLIRRQSLRVPLTRLQAVDVVRPLLARMLGLAEVRIVVAGHGSNHTRLAYLTEERAAEVRAQLLALAHGLEPDTPEPGERPLLAVPSTRIVAAALLAPGAVLLLAMTAFIATAVVANPEVAATLGGTTAVLGLAAALGLVRRIDDEWEFSIAEAPDGLRLRSGLLQHRAETIPYGRTQAVRWVEPVLWRIRSWVRLEIDVARHRDRDPAENQSGAANRALLPVGSPGDAQRLLSRVLPGSGVTPPPGSLAPTRTSWRAPLLRHNLHAWYDDTYVVCVTGRVRRSVVVVPLEKIQSVRWVQGPVSRLLRLATVHVDTAGRHFSARAAFRDVEESHVWVARLTALAAQRMQPAVTPTRRPSDPPPP